MNISETSIYGDKLESLASGWENDGYTVVKRPTVDQLPFDLFGYVPDLIATRDNAGLIVEVRTRASRTPVGHFRAIAEEIADHPGWRFMMVTLDECDAASLPGSARDLPPWFQLIDKLARIDTLLADGLLEPGMLYLGSVFLGALRKRALDQHIPIERFPPAMLLDHMYSQGEVSVTGIDSFHELMNIYKRLTCGACTSISPSQARELLDAVRNLVAGEWGNPVPE